MTTLNELGMPWITGVLHPALAHRFRVLFLTKDNQPLPNNINVLTQQVVSVSPHELFSNSFGLSGGTLPIEFELDIFHNTVRALIMLREEFHNEFNVRIEYLDGIAGVLRTTTFKNCAVGSVSESKLDYALSSTDEIVRIESRYPSLTRTDEMVEAISKNELWSSMEMFIEMLNKAEIRMVTPAKRRKQESVTLRLLSEISYTSVETVFPE